MSQQDVKATLLLAGMVLVLATLLTCIYWIPLFSTVTLGFQF